MMMVLSVGIFSIVATATSLPTNYDVSSISSITSGKNFCIITMTGFSRLLVSSGNFSITSDGQSFTTNQSVDMYDFNGSTWINKVSNPSFSADYNATVYSVYYSSVNILNYNGTIFFKPPLNLVTAVKAAHPEQVLRGIIILLGGGFLILLISLIAFRHGWKFLLTALRGA